MDSIKKLDINIVLPPDIPRSSAMEWANKCYERCFRQAIEKAVSSFDDSIGIVIPEISIDLGGIEESEIPFLLESRLKDEIARHIRSISRTVEETDADDGSMLGESPEQASASDRVRFANDGSALPDKWGETVQATAKTADDRRDDGVTMMHDDGAAAPSGDILREGLVRTLEEELFLAYLDYISDGYSDLEVLGRRYSFQEIADMIEATLVSSDHPDRKERMSFRLRQTLENHFPLSFFRMERTLPFPVFSRIILSPSDEVTRMIETMIEEGEDSGSVSMALFAVSSFRARQRAGRRIEQGFPKVTTEELTSFIKKLSGRAAEGAGSVLTAADLGPLFESMPENTAYHPLADALQERSGLSDVLDGIKRIAGTRVMEKEPEKQETERRLFTEDAGLVLLHPFFLTLFSRLGLLNEKDRFLSLDCQVRAVHLLKCLAEGFDEVQEDNDLLFCKLLCGLNPEFLIDDEFQINERERREIEDLYGAVLQYWNPFKSSSHESMRQAFIKRKGSVEKDEKGYVVRVSGSSIDILMDDLPWEISIIILPWTSQFMVEWQKER